MVNVFVIKHVKDKFHIYISYKAQCTEPHCRPALKLIKPMVTYLLEDKPALQLSFNGFPTIVGVISTVF